MDDTPSPVMRLTRAQQRFLRLHGSPAKHPEEDPLAHVELAKSLRTFSHARLDIGGNYQHGPLFGYRENQTLHIDYALPAGYGPYPLFAMDEGYVLGASDAFRQAAPQADWIGQWLIRPDGRIPKDREIDEICHQAAETRLITEERCLLWIGWRDAQLVFLPVVLTDPTGGLVQLSCNLGYMPE